MLDFIKWFFSMILKVVLAVTLFSFYCHFLIRILEIFDIKDYLSIDNIWMIVAISSIILSVCTVKFIKSFFKKLQEQK